MPPSECGRAGSPVAALCTVPPPHEHASRVYRYWTAARSRHPRVAAAVAFAFLLLALVPLAGVGITASHLGDGLPDTSELRRIGEMDQATAVFDSRDQLVFTIYKEQRIEVPLEQISPLLVKAILSIEDQRFYDHRGFDLIRIGSAALANIRHGRAAQ